MTQQSPFAVFDIDGTLIRWQLYHAIVTQLADEGKLNQAAANSIETSRHDWRTRQHGESFRSYEQTILDGYHSALVSLSTDDFDHAVNAVFDTHKDRVYTYTRDLITRLKSEGYLLFAVSGSQHEVVQKLGDYYGFDEVIGAQYRTKDGQFTGERTSPVDLGKAPLVRDLATRWNASWKGSLAIGDSLSDAEMLALVDQPIAFNPNKQLFEAAQQHGWDIVVERKNMVYHLQQQGDDYKLTQS